jgi:alkylation response protein AidB-like acyl-CoA dehydrogenase
MLDLGFSQEQEMLRESVRGVCRTHSPLTVVRELEDDSVGYSRELWRQLGQLGLIGLMLPEEYGGGGCEAIEGVVLYEEFGRSLAPTPHFVSAVLSGQVLARAATIDQRRSWLPRIATGEAILTPAWLEPDNGFGPKGVQLRAVPEGDGWVLSGTKRHVAFAQVATALVVLARTGEESNEIDIFLVDPNTPGVTLTQQHTIASDNQFLVEFAGVTVTEADRIGAAGTGWAAWDAVMRDAIILLAALAMGGAQFALDITVQYAKDREQFGKQLGAFQALAHNLADAATAVDGGFQLMHEAAWARSVGRSTDRLAPMAKLFACQTFRDVTALGEQIFGGVGFTIDFDIQLFFRRAKALQLSWWDTRYLEEMVASSVLDA